MIVLERGRGSGAPIRARRAMPGGGVTTTPRPRTGGSTCGSVIWRWLRAAVGGGSLIYANISAVPPVEVFDAGWPREITWQEMTPHYETVGDVMNVHDIGPTALLMASTCNRATKDAKTKR